MEEGDRGERRNAVEPPTLRQRRLQSNACTYLKVGPKEIGLKKLDKILPIRETLFLTIISGGERPKIRVGPRSEAP